MNDAFATLLFFCYFDEAKFRDETVTQMKSKKKRQTSLALISYLTAALLTAPV